MRRINKKDAENHRRPDWADGDRQCVPSLRRVVDGLDVAAVKMVRVDLIEPYVAGTEDEQPARSILSLIQIDQAMSGGIERSPGGQRVDRC